MVCVEAMKVANARRLIQDQSPAYDENHFFQKEQELVNIEQQLTASKLDGYVI